MSVGLCATFSEKSRNILQSPPHLARTDQRAIPEPTIGSRMSSIKPGSRVHPKALSDISLKWSKKRQKPGSPKQPSLGYKEPFILSQLCISSASSNGGETVAWTIKTVRETQVKSQSGLGTQEMPQIQHFPLIKHTGYPRRNGHLW